MDRIKKRGIAEWTYQMYCVTLKKFYRWLRGSDDYPPEVRWLKASVRNKTNITADKLLSEKEVLKLAEVAENHRDRAFVLALYESGCRIGEILGLRMKDIACDENGALLSVSGKTGTRRIRIIASCSELMSWINVHPDSKNRDAPVWIGVGTVGRNEPLT
jgi:integrase